MRYSGESRTKRHLGGTIFGGIFLLPAIGFLVIGILPNLYDWVRMQSWESVPAQLISSNLETHHGSDATTYEVVGAYRYTFEAREYTGRRIGISGGADNVGEWHRDTYYALKQRPLQVWVNAGDPSEAVFDRDLRWGMLGFKMIFVVVFGLVGGGIVWAAGRVTKDAPPGVPLWQWDPRWRENRIRSDAKGAVVALWGFAVIWNAISAPPLFAIPKELSKGNYAILVVLLFTAVGLGLIYYAIKKTMEWRRFGVTELSMDPFPGSIGGDVGGLIELPLAANPNSKLNAQLSCMHVYTRRSGGKSRTSRSVVWQDDQPVKLEPGMRGSRVRFCFQVPDGLPESEQADSDYHEWKLNLSGELPGVNLDRGFEIPVFTQNTPVRSSVPVEREPRPDPAQAGPRQIPEKILHIRPRVDGLELFYPAFRSAHLAAVLLVMGAAFGGAGFYFLFAEVRNGPPGFMMGIFAFIGTLFFLGGLYKLGNSLRVHASPQGLQLERRVYGFAFRSLIPISDIQSVEKRIGWQQHNGAQSKAMYQLQVRKKSGSTINLGDSLPNASAAEQVLEAVKQALSLSEIAAENLVADKVVDSLSTPQIEPSPVPRKAKGRKPWFAQVINVVLNLVVFVLIAHYFFDIDLLKFFQ